MHSSGKMELKDILFLWFLKQPSEAFFSVNGGIKEVEEGSPETNIRISYRDLRLGATRGGRLSVVLKAYEPLEFYRHMLVMKVLAKGRMDVKGVLTAVFTNCYSVRSKEEGKAGEIAMKMAEALNRSHVAFPSVKKMVKGYYPLVRVLDREEVARFEVGMKIVLEEMRKGASEMLDKGSRIPV